MVGVKYIKHKRTISGFDLKEEEKMWEKVDSDVEKLGKVRDAAKDVGADPLITYLVVVTNYDPFCLAEHESDNNEEWTVGRLDKPFND